MSLIEVSNLKIAYGQKEVVHGISFCLEEGEILGLVGESGSGKSSILKAVLGYKADDFTVSGSIIKSKSSGIIFQNPYSSFNPTKKIKNHFYELAKSKTSMTARDINKRAEEILKFLGFENPDGILKSFPFRMSGGMLQRISIGLALFLRPNFLLADEPTSALDTRSKNLVLGEIVKMKEKSISTLLVSHDMKVIEKVSDRIMVIFEGHLIEKASKEKLIKNPIHPYTRALLRAVPRLGQNIPPSISFRDFDYSDLYSYLENPSKDHYVAPLRICYD